MSQTDCPSYISTLFGINLYFFIFGFQFIQDYISDGAGEFHGVGGRDSVIVAYGGLRRIPRRAERLQVDAHGFASEPLTARV
jgi:hypothetical protein